MKLYHNLCSILVGCTAVSCALSVNFNVQAATWVVDANSSNQSADFSSLQTAINSAEESDTIYVMGSGGSYELESITKPITIIGPGFGLSSQSPSAQNLEAHFDSQISITATNVFLSGLTFDNGLVIKAPSQRITVFRNWFTGKGTDSVLFCTATKEPVAEELSDIHIINNLIEFSNSKNVSFYNYSLDNAGVDIVTIVRGLIFQNNIVTAKSFLFPNGDAAIVNNRLHVYSDFDFRAVGISSQKSGDVVASGRLVNNMIRYDGLSHDSLKSNNIFSSNNLVQGSSPIWSDNDTIVENVSALTVNEGTFGQQYVLTADSPAKGAGINGEDVGIFGGKHAYNLNNRPPIPFVSGIDAPRIVGAGEGMTLTVDVQTNN